MYPDYYKNAYKITDAFSLSLKIPLSLSALIIPHHPSHQYKSLWYTYCNDLHVPFCITRNCSPPSEIIIWPLKMFHRSSIQRKKTKKNQNQTVWEILVKKGKSFNMLLTPIPLREKGNRGQELTRSLSWQKLWRETIICLVKWNLGKVANTKMCSFLQIHEAGVLRCAQVTYACKRDKRGGKQREK